MSGGATRFTLKFVILGLISSLLCGTQAVAASCGKILKAQSSISIALTELAQLRIELDESLASGNPVFRTHLSTLFDFKEKEFLEKAHNVLHPTEYRERLAHEVARLQEEREQEHARRRKLKEDQQLTLENGIETGDFAVFHRVEPGSFKTILDHDVTITKSFDLMATLTTQIIWRKLALLAHKKLGEKYRIALDPSHFKGDRLPVESVSYNEVQSWIEALNELSATGESELIDIIPDHQFGDVYRLPTEAERELVVSQGRKNKTAAELAVNGFLSRKSDLGDYEWFKDNSEGKTHPVAIKKPLLIGGKNFYDLRGNVSEWIKDFSVSFLESEPLSGIDPEGTPDGPLRIASGGSFSSNAYTVDMPLSSSAQVSPEDRLRHWGFRLARMAR